MSETKQCPFCAEDIKPEAIFCRFCQHDLPAEDISKPATSTSEVTSTDTPADSKIACTNCGAMILPMTAERNDGLCTPCAKKGVKSNTSDSENKSEEEFTKNDAVIAIGALVVLGLLIWGGIALVNAIGWGGIFIIAGVIAFFCIPFLRKTGGLLCVILGVLSCFMSIFGIGIILGIPLIIIGGILLFI